MATWLKFRADAPVRESMKRGLIKDWMPEKIIVPEIATNLMLIGFFVVCVMAQWAVYSAKRNDRPHTGLALSVSALMTLAILNAQIFIWTQMGVAARDGAFHSMFCVHWGHDGFAVIGLGVHRCCCFSIFGWSQQRRRTLVGPCSLLVLPNGGVLRSVVHRLCAEVTVSKS